MVFVKTSALAIAVLIASTAPHPSATVAGPAKYAVVVNPANKYQGSATAAKGLVKRLFLLDAMKWPDGTKAVPLGRKDKDPSAQEFYKICLGMNAAELARHWISVKQRTGKGKPRAMRSDKIAITLVKKKPGAFAVVSLDAAKKAGKDIRILFEL